MGIWLLRSNFLKGNKMNRIEKLKQAVEMAYGIVEETMDYPCAYDTLSEAIQEYLKDKEND
jgi:hypothetical protein